MRLDSPCAERCQSILCTTICRASGRSAPHRNRTEEILEGRCPQRPFRGCAASLDCGAQHRFQIADPSYHAILQPQALSGVEGLQDRDVRGHGRSRSACPASVILHRYPRRSRLSISGSLGSRLRRRLRQTIGEGSKATRSAAHMSGAGRPRPYRQMLTTRRGGGSESPANFLENFLGPVSGWPSQQPLSVCLRRASRPIERRRRKSGAQ